ncbi:hypothetical protein SLE2022_001820 [Rubroshorea leprosula]
MGFGNHPTRTSENRGTQAKIRNDKGGQHVVTYAEMVRRQGKPEATDELEENKGSRGGRQRVAGRSIGNGRGEQHAVTYAEMVRRQGKPAVTEELEENDSSFEGSFTALQRTDNRSMADEDDVDVVDIVVEVAEQIGEVAGEVDDNVEDIVDEMAKTEKTGINVEEEVQFSNLNNLELGVAVKIADRGAAKSSGEVGLADASSPVAFMINGVGSENHAFCMVAKGSNEEDLNGDGCSFIGDGRRETDSISDLKMAATSMHANEELLEGVGCTCLRPDNEKVLGLEDENVEGGPNHEWASKVSGPEKNEPPISISCARSNLLGQPHFKTNQQVLRSFWEGLESESGEVAEWMRTREHKVKRKQRKRTKSCASIYKETGIRRLHGAQKEEGLSFEVCNAEANGDF